MAILINLSKSHNIFSFKNLSLKAKGLYIQLSQFKNKTRFSIDQIISLSRDNRSSIYAGLKELENKGLLYRTQIRNDRNSRLGLVVYILYPDIKDSNFLHTEILHTELLNTEFLNTENLNVYYTTSINNNSNNKSNNKLVSVIFFETEIKKLLSYWQSNITKHHTFSNTYKLGKKRLERKYNHLNRNQLFIKRKGGNKASIGYKKLRLTMRLYKKLLRSSESVFIDTLPYKVPLPDFFAFNSYIKHNYKKETEGIGSWYSECSRGEEYCFKKYAKHTIVESLLIKKFPTKDEEVLTKAAERYLGFFKTIQNKLNLPDDTDSEYATRFLKYLFKFIDHKFKNRKFKLFILLNKKFLDIEFVDYLQDMDWLK
jgi:hypothetical protein